MTVVRNEFERGENSPQRVLSERVASTAFLWHNYGKSTIGSREDLEKVPAERLAAFYKKYYQPDNTVVAIGGKLDEPKTLQWVGGNAGPDSAARAQAGPDLHRRAHAGRRCGTWNCGASAKGRK